MRPLRSRLIALVLAIAVLVPVMSFGRVAWACSMSGRVVETCCCPSTVVAPDAHAVTRLQSQDCCEMRVGQPDAAVTASADGAIHVHPAVVGAYLALAEPQVYDGRSAARPPHRSRAPPGARDPLFIRHCSLRR